MIRLCKITTLSFIIFTFAAKIIVKPKMKNTKSKIRIIADAGSTKTDWSVTRRGETLCKCSTQGMNPVHQTDGQISYIIDKELMPQLTIKLREFDVSTEEILSLKFYGAGCRGANAATVHTILTRHFPLCTEITVGSDLLAAAHAVCGNSAGIACILGTGANSCLYDGKDIVMNTPPLGYILGDEEAGRCSANSSSTGFSKEAYPRLSKTNSLAPPNRIWTQLSEKFTASPWQTGISHQFRRSSTNIWTAKN